MRDAVLYAALVLMSVVEGFVGCAAEVVRSNIIHVKNGRTPNAGCSILPLIPVLQIVYVGAALCLNHVAPNLGFAAVGGLSVFLTCYSCYSYKKARPQLELLLAKQSSAT